MRRKGYNPKRKIAPADVLGEDQRADLAQRVIYRGSPYHKNVPSDYGLTPPASPRPGKTLCDANGPFLKANAEKLLKSGILKGMISQQQRGEWPQNVWAVSEDGMPFEAELENQGSGEYHGYPISLDDDFREDVLEEWKKR